MGKVLSLLRSFGLSGLVACAADANSRSSNLVAVADRGVLRVGTTGDYEPFTYREAGSGRYRGIDIDLARSLAQSLGVKLELVHTTWATLVSDFRQGRFDMAMGGISITQQRRQHAWFSRPYQVDGKAAIARCGEHQKYRTVEQIDRAGVRLVVNPGGTNEEFVRRNMKQAQIIVHNDNTTIFRELAEGRADVMITDAVEAKLQATRDSRLCASATEAPFTRDEKAYLIRPGDWSFKRYVDNWLDGVERSGLLQRTFSRWLRR